MSPATLHDRCPACDAALAPGAQWCSLCYADLRAPEPAAEPPVMPPVEATVEPPVTHPAEPAHAVAAAVAEAAIPAQAAVSPVGAVAIADAAPAANPDAPTGKRGWPCFACDAVVSYDESNCPDCGSPFLAGLADRPVPALRVPGVGPVETKASKVAFVTGGMTLVGLVLMFVMFLLGHMF